MHYSYRQIIKFDDLCIFNAHEESYFNNQGKCDKASATENFHLHSHGSFANLTLAGYIPKNILLCKIHTIKLD